MAQKKYNDRHCPDKPGALYREVEWQVLVLIAGGRFKPGDTLPGEWDLAARFSVSQGTVRKGLDLLVSKGFLTRRQGAGTVVSHFHPDWGVSRPFFTEEPPGRSFYPSEEILSVVSQPADGETARKLELQAGDAVWKVLCLWRNGYRLIALDEVFLSVARFPELKAGAIHRRSGISMYLVRQYGICTELLWQRVCQQEMPDGYRRLLKTDSTGPVLVWERFSGDASGRPAEWRRRFLCSDGLMWTAIQAE